MCELKIPHLGNNYQKDGFSPSIKATQEYYKFPDTLRITSFNFIFKSFTITING